MWAYLLVLLIILGVYFIIKNSQYVKFEVDNDVYQVEKDSPDGPESLQTLVNIRKKLERLVHHLLNKYPKNKLVKRLQKRFKDTVLREANPDGDSSQTSYTINKGDTIVLCLRTNDGQIVAFNTLMYVAIHELAHIYSSSYHHNNEFWSNMKFLIEEGIEAGVYEETDYYKNPVRYCGMTIASNIPKTLKQTGGGNRELIYSMLHSKTILAN